jgi:uroporphyrinogen-III synthase
MKNLYILSHKKYQDAINLPVTTMTYPKPTIDFKKYDILIVASKYALISIKSNYKYNNYKTIPIYAISLKTAKVVKHIKASLHFVGTSKNGDDFAIEILEMIRNKKVLYLRGDKNVSNLTKILKQNGINCDEKIVYKSICIKYDKQKTLPKNSTIIFSSPSTVECFLKNYFWDKSFKIKTFGQVTRNCINNYLKLLDK